MESDIPPVDFRQWLVDQLQDLWAGKDPNVAEIQVCVTYGDGTDIVAMRRFNGKDDDDPSPSGLPDAP